MKKEPCDIVPQICVSSEDENIEISNMCVRKSAPKVCKELMSIIKGTDWESERITCVEAKNICDHLKYHKNDVEMKDVEDVHEESQAPETKLEIVDKLLDTLQHVEPPRVIKKYHVKKKGI